MDLTKERNSFLKTSVRSVDDDNLRITHTVNTKALDRYNTVVLPKGAEVKHFLNNAVVLWCHNMDSSTVKIPIGRCIALDVKEDEIEVTTEFNKNDPLAVKVFNAYKDGFLHAWSIGFIPLQYKKYDEENIEDLNAKYGLSITKEQLALAESFGVYLIYKWELLEYSAVPVPGNPEALNVETDSAFKREMVSRGLISAGEVTLAVNAVEEPNQEDTTSEIEPEVDPVQEDVVPEATPAEESENADEPTEETVVTENIPEDAVVSEETDVPVESTVDNTVNPESVAENIPAQSESDERLVTLAQENTVLSERIAQLEKQVVELVSLKDLLEEIKSGLDVDNIEKVREVAQKTKGENSKSWFSNYLRNA